MKEGERGRPIEGIELRGPELEGDIAAAEEEREWEEEEVPTASEAMAAMYWMTFFVFSVFPAPDSPLTVSRRQWKVRIV